MKIVVDDKIPFLEGILENYFDVVYKPGKFICRADLLDVDALLVRTRTNCNGLLLNNTNLKFIATATIGHDHIDAAYCKKVGIEWANSPGCNAWAVQQYVIASVLEMAQKYSMPLNNLTLGVVGAGHVGKKVAESAVGLGLKVLVNDPPREMVEGGDFVSLQTIMEEADFITFHVPLTVDGEFKTYHMADDLFFGNLKKRPVVINSSRGEVISGEALKRALISGLIRGAVVDVWENEPTVDVELLRMVDIATPHIAGYSVEGKANGTAMAVQALSRFFGLGIDSWKPTSVPMPSNPLIEPKNNIPHKTILEAVRATYKVMIDDHTLRSSIRNFEKQRTDYNFRNEFSSFCIDGSNLDEKLEKRFKRVGFEVKPR